jgi:hypothetical protein
VVVTERYEYKEAKDMKISIPPHGKDRSGRGTLDPWTNTVSMNHAGRGSFSELNKKVEHLL